MTECTPIAAHQYRKELKIASSGPGAGAEIMLDGGEICVKGPVVFKGYEVREHMDEDPNIAAFQGGWFHTGDMGALTKTATCRSLVVAKKSSFAEERIFRHSRSKMQSLMRGSRLEWLSLSDTQNSAKWWALQWKPV
jgi:acyl-CoA synthetase (AMP-forming)/AMP-acid ligase II